MLSDINPAASVPEPLLLPGAHPSTGWYGNTDGTPAEFPAGNDAALPLLLTAVTLGDTVTAVWVASRHYRPFESRTILAMKEHRVENCAAAAAISGDNRFDTGG